MRSSYQSDPAMIRDGELVARLHQMWTRIDIEPDASLNYNYYVHERCDINKEDEVATCYCLYGPCELELYNHFRLRQYVIRQAKLNVWYPGSWQSQFFGKCLMF